MSMTILWLENSYRIKLANLTDLEGAYVADATVGATLYDQFDVEVGDPTDWPVTLAYDGNGDGTYIGALPADLDVVAQQQVLLKVVASKTGLQATWKCEAVMEYRGGCNAT
jgi:hypothetical protein